VAEIKRHRRFGASGNRHSRGQGIGEIQVENPDIIGAVRSGGTGVGDPERAGIAVIGKSEFLRTREPGHRKFRNPDEIGIIHWRDAWQSSSAIGVAAASGYRGSRRQVVYAL
jgi:hypothetical protein